ncbi:MAG: ATP-binding protein [Phycisphaerae bacterium]|nr:ATP-binding protein [Phycisphaerae bacterium]
MRYQPRAAEPTIARAARAFPAVVLTGPRRAGKTVLLRHLFPHASYVLLEDPAVVARVRADPGGTLDALRPPVILDEFQRVPEIINAVRARIDAAPRRTGQFLLTGSYESLLMDTITDSLAGRVAVLKLLPLSAAESSRVSPFRGGYPEVLARPRTAHLWFSSYLQTYLERDVRDVTRVRDLATFRRFLAILATRHAQCLNKTQIAAPLGVSVPTIDEWLGVLEITAQVLIVPPYFENAGKRLIKSPKVYFSDSGLACHLLGIDTPAELARSPFRGPIFEGFIASEIVKNQAASGRRRELYHFRDEQGLEVDFLVPGKNGSPTLIECKASRTALPADAGPMLRLNKAMTANGKPAARMLVVHDKPGTPSPTPNVVPGVRAADWGSFLAHV